MCYSDFTLILLVFVKRDLKVLLVVCVKVFSLLAVWKSLRAPTVLLQERCVKCRVLWDGVKAAAPCSCHDCKSDIWNIPQCYVGAPGSARAEIRLSQSEPFHIIGQGHLLSCRSGEVFPTNATRLAGSSILCFNASSPLVSFSTLPLFFCFPIRLTSNSTPPFSHLLHFICLHLFLIFLWCIFFSYWLRIAKVCDGPTQEK